jgi:uncharacterized protein YndB with AHSA1/START domain
MLNNNVTLHKVIKASPEKVYRAFTNPTAIASWLPPYGYVCAVQELDVKVGGGYKMSFTNFTTEGVESFSGTYLEVEPDKFLKYIDKFDNPQLPGEIMTTISLKKVSTGTDLTITQENIPEAIPAEMCYLGWQDSLDKLTRLVEPEIHEG